MKEILSQRTASQPHPLGRGFAGRQNSWRPANGLSHWTQCVQPEDRALIDLEDEEA